MKLRRTSRLLGMACAVVVVGAGLLGCVDSGPEPMVVSPAPSSPTPQGSTPTPTEIPVAPVVRKAERVHVSAEAVDVLTADGTVLDSFTYRQLTAEVLAGLSSHLGEPTMERFPSGNHNGEGTRYIWESLVVSSEDRWAELPDDELPGSTIRWFVRVTGPTANGVTVDTVDGIRVGDSTDGVIAAHPDASESIIPGGGLPRVDIFLGSVPPPFPVETYGAEAAQWRVWLLDEEPTDAIQEIIAPSPNYGA